MYNNNNFQKTTGRSRDVPLVYTIHVIWVVKIMNVVNVWNKFYKRNKDLRGRTELLLFKLQCSNATFSKRLPNVIFRSTSLKYPKHCSNNVGNDVFVERCYWSGLNYLFQITRLFILHWVNNLYKVLLFIYFYHFSLIFPPDLLSYQKTWNNQ